MSSPIDTVWRDITILHANGDHLTATIGALWDPRTPYWVRLLISTSAQTPVGWHLDRDLLAAGLDRPVGEEGADWMVFPDPTRPDGHGVELVLALHRAGVGRQVAVQLDVEVLRDFLDATFDAVPAGAELDVALDELTGGAA